jgi:hypothetical protein
MINSLSLPQIMILQKLSRMPNTIPKPKATKRLMWNLRKETKPVRVHLRYRIECRRSSACEEATKAQNSRLQVLRSCLLSLSLSLSMTRSNNITLLYTEQEKPRAGAEEQAVYLPTEKTTKGKDQEETRKRPTTTTAEVGALLLVLCA